MSPLFNCITFFQSYGTSNTICMLPVDTTLFFYLKRQSWSSLRLILDLGITLLGSSWECSFVTDYRKHLVIPVQCITKQNCTTKQNKKTLWIYLHKRCKHVKAKSVSIAVLRNVFIKVPKIPPHASVKNAICGFFFFKIVMFPLGIYSVCNFNLRNIKVNGNSPTVNTDVF